MLGQFEKICDFVESTEKKQKSILLEVESSLKLDQTFARLPYNFSFVKKNYCKVLLKHLRGEKLNYKTRWAPDKTVAMDDF